MKFTIVTIPGQSFEEADKSFTKEYLVNLNPQHPPFKILRFDGIEKGGEIHIDMNFVFFHERWEYIITQKTDNGNEWSFTDEGIKMPFFLKSWTHTYCLKNENGNLAVSDTVIFKTPFFLFDYLMYPWLYFHFLYRRPVYKKRFGSKKAQ